MNKFFIAILAISLVSNPTFAEKTPDRSRSSNPDRGGERGSKSRGSDFDGRGSSSPDDSGRDRGGWDQVDWSSGNSRGSDSVDRRESDQMYLNKFMSLRSVFQTVDPSVREDIKNIYEPNLAFWATLAAAATATWVFVKNNPGKVAARTAGVVFTLVTYSANAGEDYDGMIEEDLFNIFDQKFWDVEAVRYALASDYRPKIERILDLASANLCDKNDSQNQQIEMYCNHP